MQSNNRVKLITIPTIPRSPLCPGSVVSNFLSSSGLCESSPFHVKNAQSRALLTDSGFRRHFSLILTSLELAHSGYTVSGVQVPPLLSITMQHYKIFKGMAPGCRTVSGMYITNSTDAVEQVTVGVYDLKVIHISLLQLFGYFLFRGQLW